MNYSEVLKPQKPQLTLDLSKVERNVFRICRRLQERGVTVRPHFKTHQSAALGEMFRDVGVTAITVSSLDMATYFADHGWQDITLAVPVNHRQLKGINQLVQRVRLHLLIDSVETATALDEALEVKSPLWIKVDVGYGRVGVPWDRHQEVLDLVQWVHRCEQLDFCGLLTHSGHTYECRGREQVIQRFEEGRQRMLALRQMLEGKGISAQISMGDTPSASLAEEFQGVDEMRPGNFVFYDVLQNRIGGCQTDDIAVATACPVIGKYEKDMKVVVYGGSVHLSKDSVEIDGERLFGQLALPTPSGWQPVPLSEAKIVSCCQEVSKVMVSRAVFDQIELGQILYILPAHSCLTAEIYPHYVTTGGEIMERFRLFR